MKEAIELKNQTEETTATTEETPEEEGEE